ncbi:MAG: hypothetical protein AAFV33_26025, partial [Chloroflexota bacterium]
ATFSERAAVDRKEEVVLHRLQPDTFCGDDAYTKASRIRQWAKQDGHLPCAGEPDAMLKFIVVLSSVSAILRPSCGNVEPPLNPFLT